PPRQPQCAELRRARKSCAEQTAPISIATHPVFGWGPRMAVDGHGRAMTIADYSAIGVLIVLAGDIGRSDAVSARQVITGALVRAILRAHLSSATSPLIVAQAHTVIINVGNLLTVSITNDENSSRLTLVQF